MKSFLLRSTAAASLAACCSFSVYGISNTSSILMVAPSVVAVSVGTPIGNPCTNASISDTCVGVPLEVTQSDTNGVKRTVPLQVSLTKDVANKVRQQFPDASAAVFRNLAEALKRGLGQDDPKVQQACAEALPSVESNVHYKVLQDVKMPAQIEAKVAAVADKAFEVAQKDVVVTSGTRTPESQASAIQEKLVLGDNVAGLYKDKLAVGAILHAYREAKHEGKDAEEATDAMADVIQHQVDDGVFISNHLRDNAVDLRISDLNGWQKRMLKKAAESIPGVSVHEESIPPHFHLDIL